MWWWNTCAPYSFCPSVLDEGREQELIRHLGSQHAIWRMFPNMPIFQGSYRQRDVWYSCSQHRNIKENNKYFPFSTNNNRSQLRIKGRKHMRRNIHARCKGVLEPIIQTEFSFTIGKSPSRLAKWKTWSIGCEVIQRKEISDGKSKNIENLVWKASNLDAITERN